MSEVEWTFHSVCTLFLFIASVAILSLQMLVSSPHEITWNSLLMKKIYIKTSKKRRTRGTRGNAYHKICYQCDQLNGITKRRKNKAANLYSGKRWSNYCFTLFRRPLKCWRIELISKGSNFLVSQEISAACYSMFPTSSFTSLSSSSTTFSFSLSLSERGISSR